jgi:hypothetical protein
MESGTRETAKQAFIILAKSQGLLPEDFDTSKTHVVAADYMKKSLESRARFDVVGREVGRLLAAFVCALGDYDSDATEAIIGTPPERITIKQYKQNAFALLSGAVLMAAMSDTGMTVEVALRGVICDMTKIMDGIGELSTSWISSVGGMYDTSELSYDDLQVCFDGLFCEWEKHRVEYIEAISEGAWDTINAVVSKEDGGLVTRCGVLLMNLLILMNTTGVEVDVGMAIAADEDGYVNLMPPLIDLDFLTDKDKEYLSNLFDED